MGFARLARPTYAGANMGHPYGVAATPTTASARSFVYLPQQASLLEMTSSYRGDHFIPPRVGDANAELMSKCCSPVKDDTGCPEERVWKGFARLINPGTQTREPGAPLRSCHNLSGSFRLLFR
jgi:hypothetical protein